MLRFLGAKLGGVPRTPTGYDLAALEALLAEHKPKAFSRSPACKARPALSPSAAHLHRLLQLAETHGFTLVENDIYAEHGPDLALHAGQPGPAAACGLHRQLSPNHFPQPARWATCWPGASSIEDLAQLKMISGLTSSDIAERLTFGVVTDGSLAQAPEVASREAGRGASQDREEPGAAWGLSCSSSRGAGMYLWARHPDLPDGAVLSKEATPEGIMLGAGTAVPAGAPSHGLAALNVAFCDDERIWRSGPADRAGPAGGPVRARPAGSDLDDAPGEAFEVIHELLAPSTAAASSPVAMPWASSM